jgi:anaerobic ribonucleoside-triphosphate reductase activating protein
MLLHALIPASRANGPGIRAVVFFQGCSIGCPKCWNPSTHQFLGTEVTVDVVAQQVLRAHQEHTLQGVTFSGGEPMQQADSLLRLIQCLHQQAPELSFGMFSGYAEHELAKGQYWARGDGSSELRRKSLWQEIRAFLDFAILGRFNQAQPSSLPLRTSRNQVLRLFSDRYTPADFSEELIEVSIHEGGRAEVTGFPILGLPW